MTYYKKEAKKQNHINHREAKQLFIKIILKKGGGGLKANISSLKIIGKLFFQTLAFCQDNYLNRNCYLGNQ